MNANKQDAGGLLYTDHSVTNGLLCDFGTRWVIDGDYIRCRACKRPQLTSYAENDFPHASDCRDKDSPTMERRPWQTYVELLAPLCRAAPAGGDRCAFESAMKSAGWADSMFMRSPVPGHDDLYYEPATSSAWTAWRIAKQGKPDSAPAGSGEVEELRALLSESRQYIKGDRHRRFATGYLSTDEHDDLLRRIQAALLRKLQQGAESFVSCTCHEERQKALCLNKHRCVRAYPLASQGQEGGTNG